MYSATNRKEWTKVGSENSLWKKYSDGLETQRLKKTNTKYVFLSKGIKITRNINNGDIIVFDPSLPLESKEGFDIREKRFDSEFSEGKKGFMSFARKINKILSERGQEGFNNFINFIHGKKITKELLRNIK